jgi:glutathione S-transferase
VICEYLDEVFPDPPLAPRDPLGRARMRAWLRFIDEVPSMAVRVPSFNKVLLPGYRAMDPAAFAARVGRMTLRRTFFRRMGQTGFSETEVADAMEQLALTESRIAAALVRDGGPFLLGATISCADLCLAPVVNRMEELGILGSGATTPEEIATVRNWLAGLRARPSWSLAFGAGSEMRLPAPSGQDRPLPSGALQ